jgi:hypothetical protein
MGNEVNKYFSSSKNERERYDKMSCACHIKKLKMWKMTGDCLIGQRE